MQDWAKGFIDRDNKFVHEFQTTFNSSFWELYLHAVLKHLGCSVDFSVAAPDFVVNTPTEFCIEAVVASHAVGCISASESHQEPILSDLNAMNRQAIIRLANSFSTKFRKYNLTYSKLLHCQNKPFVLAIAPFDRPHFYLPCQRAIEAFLFNYYVDEETYLKSNKLELPLVGQDLKSVSKDSGAEIEIGVFNDPEFSAISAVLFATAGSWGKVRALASDADACTFFKTVHYNPHSISPTVSFVKKCDYHETILDGLRIYHNPHATFPLDVNLFSAPEVFQSYFDHDSGEWVYETSSKNLLCRMVRTFMKHDS